MGDSIENDVRKELDKARPMLANRYWLKARPDLQYFVDVMLGISAVVVLCAVLTRWGQVYFYRRLVKPGGPNQMDLAKLSIDQTIKEQFDKYYQLQLFDPDAASKSTAYMAQRIQMAGVVAMVATVAPYVVGGYVLWFLYKYLFSDLLKIWFGFMECVSSYVFAMVGYIIKEAIKEALSGIGKALKHF
jgi:hypothetical protein